MQKKHSSQMASLISKMLGQKAQALTNTSGLRLIEKLAKVCLQYQVLVVILWWYIQWSKASKLTESAENLFECKKQALPLRGHGSGEDSNFTQLYILWRKKKRRTEGMGDTEKINKFVNSTIQNEMMEIMALRGLRKVAGNIRDIDFTR